MTVKELIEALKEIDENKKVVIQFRDEGEDYPGQDETIYLDEFENVIVL